MNIICFAPFSAAWDLHGYIESAILQSLHEKGCNIIHVFCDIQSEYCYLYLHSTAACQACVNVTNNFTSLFGIDAIFLSKFARQDDHAKARQFVDSLDPEQFQSAQYDNDPIGEWVVSTFCSYVRGGFDRNNIQHITIYSAMLTHAIEVSLALKRLLHSGHYDRALVFNGRFLQCRIFLDLVDNAAIPCYIHERGAQKNTMFVGYHKPFFQANLHPSSFEFDKDILDRPLTEKQLGQIQDTIMSNEYSKTCGNWHRYSPLCRHEDLRIYLNIPEKQRIWTFFTSSDDELMQFKGFFYPSFPTQLEGLIAIMTLVSKYDDVRLVIRMHPNTGAKGDKRVKFADSLCTYIKNKHYENVCIIDADAPVNTYQLMAISEYGLASTSSCAIEMLHRGKPSLVFTKFYSANNGIFSVGTLQELNDIITKFHQNAITDEQIRQGFLHSLRYNYYTVFRHCIPCEFFTQTSPHIAKPHFRKIRDIKNTNYPILDRLSDQILHAETIALDYMPGAADIGSPAVEKEWVDKYAEAHFN